MASPACDHRPASEVRFIEAIDHEDHPPRGEFDRGIIGKFRQALYAFGNMTVDAVQADGGCKHPHRTHEFIHGNSLKDRNVFEDFFCHLRLGFLRCLTSHRSSGDQASNEYSSGAQDRSPRSNSHGFLLLLTLEDCETNGGQYTLAGVSEAMHPPQHEWT